MPKPYPAEFRRDVIAVARKSEASVAQVAKDFGISETCLQRWLKIADREDGLAPTAVRWICSAVRAADSTSRTRTRTRGSSRVGVGPEPSARPVRVPFVRSHGVP